MRRVIKTTKTAFSQLAFYSSYGAKLSLSFSILFETISSFQILYIILGTGFPSSQDRIYLIFHNLRNLASIIGLLDTEEIFNSNTFEVAVWFIFSLYLLLYLCFVLFVLISGFKGEKIEKRVPKLCTWLSIVHGKVLFCPIYFFYIRFLVFHESCHRITGFPEGCDNVVDVLTFIFLIINISLAVLKETAFYQIYRDENSFAVKSNLHGIIQLFHKIILMPLMIEKYYNGITNSTLNFVLILLHQVILFLYLPYFNIKSMKVSVISSTIQLTFSFVLFWKHSLQSEHKIFELLLVLVTPITVKLMLVTLNNLFQRILSLKVTSPAYVTHLFILVKEFIFDQTGINFQNTFKYKSLYYCGIIKKSGFDINDLQDKEKLKEFKLHIYKLILDEMLKSYKRFPKSKIMLLSLCQFYCEKIKNIYQANIYLDKLKELPLFPSEAIVIRQMESQIQSMLFKSYSRNDESLECLNYFKYRELSERLKNNVELEVEKHISFWQMLSKEEIDLYKLMETCYEIDKIALTIQRTFKSNEREFIKTFPVPLIMYGTYLNIVKGLPHLGHTIINTYVHGNNIKLVKTIEKLFSQEKAIIVASNQKGTIGKILDASHSVNDIFKINKEELIGRRIGILMPSMIQEKHDEVIQRYNEKAMYTLDFNKEVYCKTADSRFFHAHLSLTVYPSLDKGVALIASITKKEEYIPIFFVNIDGVIMDCSKELVEDFNLNFAIMKKVKLQDLAPDFERINRAFNVTYPSVVSINKEIEQIEPEIKSPKDLTSKGFQKRKDLRIITTTLNKDTYALTRENNGQESTRRLLKGTPTNKFNELSSLYSSDKYSDTPRLFEENSQAIIRLKNENDSLSPKINFFQGNTYNKPQYEVNYTEQSVEDNGEMDEICKQFQKEGVLAFKGKGHSESDPNLLYSVKVDTLYFQGQLYKVVKLLKKIVKEEENVSESPQLNRNRTPRQSILEANGDLFSLSLSNTLRRKKQEGLESLKIKNSALKGSSENFLSNSEENDFEYRESKHLSMEPNLAEVEINYKQDAKKEASSSKKSNYDNTNRNIRIEKVFHKVFLEAKPSKITNTFFLVFYLGLASSLGTLIFSFIKTQSSYSGMERGIQLVDMNSERLMNVVNAWGAAIYLYGALIISSTPINISSLRNLIPNGYNEIVIKTNPELIEMLKNVKYQSIIQQFFISNIELWEPNGSEELVPYHYDEFAALKIQFSKLLVFVSTNSSAELKRKDEDLIQGLNNTVNNLFISMEDNFKIIQMVKDMIFTETTSNITLFLCLELVFIGAVYASIIAYIVHLIRAYRRFLRAISIISPKSIQIRERELVQFKQYLQESVESAKFVRNFDTMSGADTGNLRKNRIQTDFKNTTKFSLQSCRVRVAVLLTISLLLLGIILLLVAIYSYQTINTLQDLMGIDAGISLVEVMSYQTFLVGANFFYHMTFYNRTDMLLRNQDPYTQLQYNLDLLRTANNRILAAFPHKGTGFYDDGFDDFLSKNVCDFIEISSPRIGQFCEVATKGYTLGLIGLNSQLYETQLLNIQEFEANPTIDTFLAILRRNLAVSGSSTSILSLSYRYIRARLLDLFINKVNEQQKDLETLFIIGCISCGIVGLLLRVFILSHFKRIHKIRFKMFKVLPLSLILENRSFLFYLRLEFSNELNEIKSIL